MTLDLIVITNYMIEYRGTSKDLWSFLGRHPQLLKLTASQERETFTFLTGVIVGSSANSSGSNASLSEPQEVALLGMVALSYR